MYVTLFMDVEDLVAPESDDAALDWLELSYGWKAPTRIKCTGTPGTR